MDKFKIHLKCGLIRPNLAEKVWPKKSFGRKNLGRKNLAELIYNRLIGRLITGYLKV